MKKIFLSLLIIALFACEKDEDLISTEKTPLWRPNPVAYISENIVKLKWSGGFVLYAEKFPGDYVEPDYFEIYISKDRYPDFVKLVKLKNDYNHEYTVTDLTPGKPVYFYVASIKKGYEKLITDTIMAIPDKETESVVIYNKDKGGSLATVSRAHNINKIAYVDKSYYWKTGENCCNDVSILISNTDGSEEKLLDIKCYEPDWSPDDKKIAFRTEKEEVNTPNGMPSQIAFYDCESKVITKLTSGSAQNYSPVFSENGELILYQSSKGVYDYNSTNIWLYDLKTSEHRQLTDLNATALLSFGKPSWIDNESFLFNAKGSNYINNIYKSSINSKTIDKVFDSMWNDYCPVMSPDKKNIVFFSDRSGNMEVWLHNIDTGRFKQLTGFSDETYIDEWWSRIEWIDNKTVAYAMNNRKYVIQNIE
ncbi:MAG: PD40 domain-containing protein [Prolixibacteraceae bacterium]|nr:PD40 domain-containing protein [Prolixibacteraceae bacterium]